MSQVCYENAPNWIIKMKINWRYTLNPRILTHSLHQDIKAPLLLWNRLPYNGIDKGIAMLLFHYSTYIPIMDAFSSKTRIIIWNSCQKGYLSCYCRMFKLLLNTYAIDNCISKVRSHSISLKRLCNVNVVKRPQLLPTKCLKCIPVKDEWIWNRCISIIYCSAANQIW